MKSLGYDPEFHDRHGHPFTEDDLEYLCKFWDYEGQEGMSFALGRTIYVVKAKIYKLRKSGKYDYYRNIENHYVRPIEGR